MKAFDLKKALEMAVEVLSKSMDSTNLTSEKLEFATVTRDDKGQVQFKVLPKEEVDELIKSVEIVADE
jgi:20S proteasome subunit alpha 3